MSQTPGDDRLCPTDGQLLSQFLAQRSQDSFAEVVRRHTGMVLRVCRARGGADAEDAAQAVFLTLAIKARSLTGAATVAGWLYRVAWYIAGRSAEAAAIRRRHEQEAARMRSEQTHLDSSAVPEAALHAALTALPEKHRLPLVLHHLEGRTEQETAALLGLGRSAASSRLSRAREELRKRLSKLGVAGSATAITAAMGSQSMAGVPATFVAAVSESAMAAAAGNAACAASTLALSKGAIHMLFMAKMKLAALVTAAVMLVGGAGVGTYLVADSTPAKRAASNLREAPSGEEDQGAVESVMLTADGCNHTLAGPPGSRTYSVAAADGQVLFAGPVNTPEQTKALDARMLAKLRELEVVLGGPNARPRPGEPRIGPDLPSAVAAAQPRPATTARATGTIIGKIVDDAGKPVGGARITLSLPKSATPGKTLGKTISDINGVFVLNDVAPGRDYAIAVGAGKPGGEETLLWGAVYGVNVAAGKTADVGTIKLIRGSEM